MNILIGLKEWNNPLLFIFTEIKCLTINWRSQSVISKRGEINPPLSKIDEK